MNRLITRNLLKAFQKLGIELTESGSFYEFEYGHIPMHISIDSDDNSFAFVSLVFDSTDGSMDENVLNSALDIVKAFHKDCCGSWNQGTPFFASSCYSLRLVSSDWLEEQLKEFYDAFLFLETNIHLLCDSSIWGTPDGIGKNNRQTE